MPEKTGRWIMITLIIKKGQEEAAKKMLREIEKETTQKGGEIVSWSNGRSEHYHILGKKEGLDKLKLKMWPGTVKRHDITESQARVVKQNHIKCYLSGEGLRQEGHSSTVMSS